MVMEQDGSKDFSVPGAGGIVSSCFEPHLAVNAELEEKDLMENLEKLVQEETWDIEDGSQTNILSSSMQVFLIIRRSLERCSALTENQKLSSLFKAFQKILKVYATKLLGRLPEGGSWIVAAATGLDGQMKIQAQGVFDFIEEPVHSPSTSFDAAPPLQACVARRPIHVPGLKKTSQRYWRRMTDRELEEMSELLNCTIIPCFEKVLSVTDVGQNSRIVIPKLCAEAFLPEINHSRGIPIEFQDISGKKWTFQFRFWLKSDTTRTYVLDGVSDCIHSMHFEAGDTITFSQMMPDKNWLIGARKAAKNDAQMELKENNELVDPWSGSTINSLLENLEADIVNYHGYFQITGPYPGEVILASLHKSGRDKELEIGGSKYRIKKCPGEGAFTQVLKAHITGNSEDVALKIRKPPFPWEFYMYRQLDLRIPQSERMSFGFAREMHLFTDCSIIISDY